MIISSFLTYNFLFSSSLLLFFLSGTDNPVNAVIYGLLTTMTPTLSIPHPFSFPLHMPKKVLALAGDELICTGIRDMDSFCLAASTCPIELDSLLYD